MDARQAVLQKAGPTAATREQVLMIPEPRTNSLIIVAKEDNYQEMAKLARDLDAAGAGYLGQIHIINLDKLNAADLAPKMTTSGRAVRRCRGRRASEDQPVITTDSRSNSLIVASNQEDFEVIAKLVEDLEQQKLSPIAQIRSVRIEHTDTTKVAEILRKLFDAPGPR